MEIRHQIWHWAEQIPEDRRAPTQAKLKDMNQRVNCGQIGSTVLVMNQKNLDASRDHGHTVTQ
jgi:hypothetical protein